MSQLPIDKSTIRYASEDRSPPPARIVTRDGWFRRVREFFYEFLIGATLSWVLVPYQIRKRQEMEQLIALIFSTDLLGIQVLPPRERLRLLPYILPRLMHWRRMTIFDRAIEGADLRHLGH